MERVEELKPTAVDDTVCGAVCFVAGGSIPGAWMIDSGCTCHMTNDRQFFAEFKSGVVVEVTLANGSKTKSSGCGSGVVMGVNGNGQRMAITLENVLYVPALEGGLISVRKLAAKGFTVLFKEKSCEIMSVNNNVVAIGEMIGCQYKLKLAEQCMVVANGNHTERCQHTWHRRFGHRDIHVCSRCSRKCWLADWM